ncbi:MAG: hypothetical protein ACXWRZ_04330 [Bdellovibrio sp.]
MKIFITTVLAFSASSSLAVDFSFNSDVLQALSVIKAEKKRVVRGFAQGDMGPLMQAALNALVENGNKMLREKNFDSEAAVYEAEWNRFYFSAFGGFSPMDLGDHKPVFEWLADYYNKLEEKLGPEICVSTRLSDIKAINFGAPVAIFPNGDPRTDEKYDITEYRKHFVPFTTAVLYWSMKIACSATLPAIPSIICSGVAVLPRNGYERFIAASLSDYVYRKSTTNAGFDFVYDDNF